MTPPFQRFAAGALLALACAGTQAQTLAAGDRHALALQSDGTVLAWGDNRQGQLGQGVTLGSTTARTIAIPGTVTSVRALGKRAMALDSQGNVWTWGNNSLGALGDGGLEAERADPRIAMRNATFISGSTDMSLAVDSQGKVWYWSVSMSPRVATEFPVRIAKAYYETGSIMAIDEAGGVWGWGFGGPCVFQDPAPFTNKTTPAKIEGLPPVQDLWITGGTYWGSGYIPVRAVAVTALDRDGNAWTWGGKSAGDCQPRKTDAMPTGGAPYAITTAGAVLSYYRYDGSPQTGIYSPPLLSNLPPVQRVSQGGNLVYALTRTGDLWEWPRASETQADDGSGRLIRKIASGVSDMAGFSAGSMVAPGIFYVTADGKLHARGPNTDLLLGIPREVESRSSPVRVPSLPAVTSVHASANGGYAVTADGKLYSWGGPFSNTFEPSYRQSPALLPLPFSVSKVAANDVTTLAIDTNGGLWHWGRKLTLVEPYQADPVRVTLGHSGNTVKAVSLNDASGALIVDTQGAVWAIGDVIGNPTPAIGGRDTPSLVQGLPAVQQVVSVGSGSFALDTAGTIWAWGRDLHAQLWEETTGILYTQPKPVFAGRKATSIHGGADAFCALLVDGSAHCTGWIFGGATGKSFRLHAPIKEIALSSGIAVNAYFKLTDGTVWAYGRGSKGQLGLGTYGSVLEPTPVNNTAGTGDLDLDPATPNVASTRRPPFRVQTTLTGGLSQFSITGRVFGGPTNASAPDGKYSVYVVAIASDGAGGPPTTWFQLNGQGQWSGVQWPMPAYAAKADLGSETLSVPLDIFRNFPGQGLQNSRVYVGYGLDAYEMIDAGRLREVLAVSDD